MNINEIQSIKMLIGILKFNIFVIMILIERNIFICIRKIAKNNEDIENNNIRKKNFIIKELIVPQTIVLLN